MWVAPSGRTMPRDRASTANWTPTAGQRTRMVPVLASAEGEEEAATAARASRGGRAGS